MIDMNYTNDTNYQFNNCILYSDNAISKVGICTDKQVENFLKCNGTVNRWVQFNIQKIIDIPDNYPDIEEIVSVYSQVEILQKKLIRTPEVTGYTTPITNVFVDGSTIPNSECSFLTGRKLIVEGILKQKVIYTALTETQQMNSMSFNIPFSQYIVVEKDIQFNNVYMTSACIEDVFVGKLSNRTLFGNSIIILKALLCV